MILLRQFVEAHLKAEIRDVFIMTHPHNDKLPTFFHRSDSQLRFQKSESDADTLAAAGLLRRSGSTFAVTPAGVDFIDQKT